MIANAFLAPFQNPTRAPLPFGTRVVRDIATVPTGHERQKMDLFVPGNVRNPPVVVAIHGGAWLAGSKADIDPAPFLLRGLAVAAVGYRLSQHALFPAQLQDVKAAVRWLRVHSAEQRVDSQRVGAWGASAGGHLAALLGVTGGVSGFDIGENIGVSSRVQAVVDLFGPTDFLQMDAHRLEGGMRHDPADSPESKLVGGPIVQNREKVARANPVAYVRAGAPPFLIVHGSRDPLVPHHQSELLADALRRADVPVSFFTVEGGGHGFGPQDADVADLAAGFLARHLAPR